MSGTQKQKLLDIESPVAQDFNNFIDYQEIIPHLTQAIQDKYSVHICGPTMSGKSHLAMSIYQHIILSGQSCTYTQNTTLAQNQQFPDSEWIIIDNVDHFTEAEFLVSLSQHYPETKWVTTAREQHSLADLQSRLNQANNFNLQATSDETTLKCIIKSIAHRHQYSLNESFIKQSLNFMPWHAPTVIRNILKLMTYCHHNKVRPSITNLKTIYETDSP